MRRYLLLFQQALDLRMTAPMIPVSSPSTNHHIRSTRGFLEGRIIIWAYRVRVFFKLPRVSRAIGEDIHHLKSAIPHINGAAVASFNCRVIAKFVRGGGVKHDKGNARTVVPAPPKPIPISSARAEVRPGLSKKFSLHREPETIRLSFLPPRWDASS